MVELLYSGIYGFSGIFTSSTIVLEALPDLNVSKHDTERDGLLSRFCGNEIPSCVIAALVVFGPSPEASALYGTATEPAFGRLRRSR
jgi:hypothetical protein